MNLEQKISELQARNREKHPIDGFYGHALLNENDIDQLTTDTAHQAYQAGVREAVEVVKKTLCSRVGIHTCRVGSVHVTEGEKERVIKALQDNK